MKSSNCLDVCRETRNADGDTWMTPCFEKDDGSYGYRNYMRHTTSWCCGGSNACCTNGVGVVTLPTNFTRRAVSTATSSSATATSTPLPSSLPLPQSVTSGHSTGAKAGIGVSAAVGAIAAFLALFFGHKAYSYKKQTKKTPEEVPHGSTEQET